MPLFHRIHFAIAMAIVPAFVNAGDTIVLPPGRFQVDHELHLIVSDLPTDSVNVQWPGLKSTVRADDWYSFSPAMANIALGVDLTVLDTNGTAYHLFFTALPIIGITTFQAIVDEPRVHGHFLLSDSTGQVTTSNLGIEFRGGSSQFLPKKSYRIEFWNDTTGAVELDQSLLGMRSDDDWNLLAQYNEPLRLRNLVCNSLWRMIHAPYYQNLEPDAVTGVVMKHAELFINGGYQGIYALSERLDRKQLKLKKYNGSIRGELYKGVSWGASTFSSAPPYENTDLFWSGFEYDYPTEVTDWSTLHDFVDFVVNASDADFLAGYSDRFVLGNAVDYFIFLNLLRATDNTGKNIFIAKYDAGTPYFYVPFDLDGTFGTIWDGSQQNITDDLLLNGFYERLIHDCRSGGFTEVLQQRWNALRTDIITLGAIIGLFQQEHDRLATSGVYQREMMAWPDYVYEPAQLDLISTWLNARIAFLDSRFNAPCEPIGISETVKATFSMYPNPAVDRLMVVLDTPGIPAELCLTDPLGRTVLRQTLSSGGMIDLTALNKGLYLVQLRQEDRTTTEKLVIK